MPETADIIEANIEKFDALRETFLETEARCFLIKSAEHSGELEIVLELLAGWYFRCNEYRQQMRIAYATLDDSFVNLATQTSFFAYGTPDADGAIDVYKIEDDQRDKVAPNGANPYWKFYVLRVQNERFTIPQVLEEADDMRISSTLIDAANPAATSLYTVPPGKRLVLTSIVFRDSTADFAPLDDSIFLSFDGGATSFNIESFGLTPTANVQTLLYRPQQGETGEVLSLLTFSGFAITGNFYLDLIGYLIDE